MKAAVVNRLPAFRNRTELQQTVLDRETLSKAIERRGCGEGRRISHGVGVCLLLVAFFYEVGGVWIADFWFTKIWVFVFQSPWSSTRTSTYELQLNQIILTRTERWSSDA